MEQDLKEAPKIPELQTSERDRERRGGGLPWLPNLALAQGKGVAANLLLILASKVGMIAAIGTLAAASAGVGVMMRPETGVGGGPASASAAQAMASRMRQNAAGGTGAAGSVGLVNGADNSMDGMAYVRGAFSAQPTAQAGQSNGGAAAADGGAAAAKSAQAAATAAPDAVAAAAAAAAAAGQAAQAGANGSGSASAKTLLAKLPSFSNGNVGSGGMPAGAAVGGRTNGFGAGVDPSLRSSPVDAGSRQALAATGRFVQGIGRSEAAGQLVGNSAVGRGNLGSSAETASAASGQGFDTASTPASMIAGGAGQGSASPSPSSNGVQPGTVPGEGGPISGPAMLTPAQAPNIPAYSDSTPWKYVIGLAKVLLALSVIIGLALAASQWVPFLQNVQMMLRIALGAIGGIIAMLGLVLVGMGQYKQGMIWVGIGAAIAGSALLPAIPKIGPLVGGIAAAGAGGIGMLLDSKNIAGASLDSLDTSKEDYKKQYGIDPDTNLVINPAHFDAVYGQGASDAWNLQHGDMSAPPPAPTTAPSTQQATGTPMGGGGTGSGTGSGTTTGG